MKGKNTMSKAIGRIYGVGSRSTYGYETDYMKYLQGYNPYIYGGAEFVGAMTTPMHLAKGENFKQKAFNALTDTLNASAGYAQNKDDFLTNLAVNGIANVAGLPIDVIPFTRAAGRPLVQFGKKFIKQGINSSADKIKNAILHIFDNDASSARPEGSMEVVKLYWWKHNSKLGQYSAAKVRKTLEITKKANVVDPKSSDDYEIKTVDLDGLSPEVLSF